jgi:hypothetical protein
MLICCNGPETGLAHPIESNQPTAMNTSIYTRSAVPQLIEALSDKRYTRSYPILRIGDASRVILERIAHRSFGVRDGTYAGMTNAVHAANVIAAVKSWWDVYRVGGEQAALVEGVAAWQTNSVLHVGSLEAGLRRDQATLCSQWRRDLLERSAPPFR